jgi:hypothetical protein
LFDLAARRFETGLDPLGVLRRNPVLARAPAPIGSPQKRHRHLHVPETLLARLPGRRKRFVHLPPAPEKQFRILENAKPNVRRRVSPGAVDLANLSRREPVPSALVGETKRIRRAPPSHRYQEPHR